MSAASVADLVDQLRKGRLLDAARLDKVIKAQDRFPDAPTLARELVKRGWLTREQAQTLLNGPPAEAPAAAPPSAPPRRRRGAWLLALLALLLLGGAAGVAVWWTHSPKPVTDPRAGNDGAQHDKPSAPQGCSDTSRLKEIDDLEFGDPVRVPFDPKVLDALKGKPIPAEEVYPWQPQGLVAVLGEHRMRGRILAANPDGTLLAVAGLDNFLRVGPIDTLHEQAVLGGRTGTYALAWSPKGDLLASADTDGLVRLWDVRKLNAVPEAVVLNKERVTVTCLSFSHDGKYLIGGGPTQDGNGTLRLWNVATKEEVYNKPQSGPVMSVAFSPVAGDYRVLWGGGPKDGKLYLGDGEKGEAQATVDCRFAAKKKEDERTFVSHVAFSPDGKRAVSGHFDWNLARGVGEELVRVWDLDRFELGKEKVIKGFVPGTTAVVAFGPDRKTVATALMAKDNGLALWDVSAAAGPRTLVQSIGVESLTFLPRGERKGDRIALTGWQLADHNVHVYDTASGKELRPPVGHLAGVASVAGSPDGANLVSGGNEGRVWVWDLNKVAPRYAQASGGAVSDVGFHPDGRQVFYCGAATANVAFCDVETGKPAGPAKWDARHNGAITNAAVTEDGHYVISAGYSDATIRLWDLRPGPGQGQQVRLFSSPTPGIVSVALSPDGRRALRTAGNSSVKLLHLRCQDIRHEWAGGSWNTFLPDGRVAILGGPTGVLWDIKGEKPKEDGELRLPLTGARPGDVSRDGRRLAAVVAGRVAVWNLDAEKPVWEWAPPAHFGGVNAVALSPDGRYLFTANGDGTVYVIQLP